MRLGDFTQSWTRYYLWIWTPPFIQKDLVVGRLCHPQPMAAWAVPAAETSGHNAPTPVPRDMGLRKIPQRGHVPCQKTALLTGAEQHQFALASTRPTNIMFMLYESSVVSLFPLIFNYTVLYKWLSYILPRGGAIGMAVGRKMSEI